ncbi:MAG: DUF3450 family protein, partial [Pseudomonadota bacterium]
MVPGSAGWGALTGLVAFGDELRVRGEFMRDVLTPARGALLASLLVGAGMTAQAQLRPALDVGEQATRRAEQVQTQINQLDDERSDLIGEFRTLVQRKDSAELNARQLAQAVES